MTAEKFADCIKMAENISAMFLHCFTWITLVVLEVKRKKYSLSRRSLPTTDVMSDFTKYQKPAEQNNGAFRARPSFDRDRAPKGPESVE